MPCKWLRELIQMTFPQFEFQKRLCLVLANINVLLAAEALF